MMEICLHLNENVMDAQSYISILTLKLMHFGVSSQIYQKQERGSPCVALQRKIYFEHVQSHSCSICVQPIDISEDG